MSDDEDDVVVLRVCANTGCMGVEDLEFDEETGEMYCLKCRTLFARAQKEGFSVLLSSEDVDVVRMIFDAFDKSHKGYWDWNDFNLFQDAIDKCTEGPLQSSDDLKQHFQSEYDIALRSHGPHAAVVSIRDLEDMYGGYLYNNIPALRDDSESLGEAGFINLGLLE